MTGFAKGQRIRVAVEYATVDGEVQPDLLPWVGLQGTVIYPADWERGYNVVNLIDPPEASPFGYRFFTEELEAADGNPAGQEAGDSSKP